jgi:Arc/MetJ-type ribon-helix-helix transcriptional regulator
MPTMTDSPLLKSRLNHPYTIHTDGKNMSISREKSVESEKITVNLGFVDLGRVDLLVQEGFYSNRADFIRTAIRHQLQTEGEVVHRSLSRHTLELGLREYSRADLERVKGAKESLHIKVVGLARIASDVTPELALATIGSITVLGALQASNAVKAALADRIH